MPSQNLRMPVSIDDHLNEISKMTSRPEEEVNDVQKIHAKMKDILKPFEYKIYEALFIFDQDEKAVAKQLGYISNEKGRGPGYKHIFNIKKTILEKARKLIEEDMIDIF